MPVSYGRTQRTCPPALRRFLVARDGGCRFPGCDRPPEWTEAHHIVWWRHGGETSAENLVLMCEAHHHAVHEGGFIIRGSPGTPEFCVQRPDGTVIEDHGRAA
jgi:hypothetical protein